MQLYDNYIVNFNVFYLSTCRISCELAELSTQLRNHDNGVRFYREALLHNESHSPARLALAQLHLSKGELEACDHECVTLLRTDPENEQAAVVREKKYCFFTKVGP